MCKTEMRIGKTLVIEISIFMMKISKIDEKHNISTSKLNSGTDVFVAWMQLQ